VTRASRIVSSGKVALGVRTEETGVESVSRRGIGMGDGQCAGAAPGQVSTTSEKRRQSAQGETQVVSGGHQSDLIEIRITAAGIVDEEPTIGSGLGPTDHRRGCSGRCANPHRAELPDHLEPRDVGYGGADLEVFLAVKPSSESGLPGTHRWPCGPGY